MSEYSLVQMIAGPTRVTQSSKSQIDLLFSSDADLLQSVGCEDPGLSDHSLIIAPNHKLNHTHRLLPIFPF